jgi:hypothetical protein
MNNENAVNFRPKISQNSTRLDLFDLMQDSNPELHSPKPIPQTTMIDTRKKIEIIKNLNIRLSANGRLPNVQSEVGNNKITQKPLKAVKIRERS